MGQDEVLIPPRPIKGLAVQPFLQNAEVGNRNLSVEVAVDDLLRVTGHETNTTLEISQRNNRSTPQWNVRAVSVSGLQPGITLVSHDSVSGSKYGSL